METVGQATWSHSMKSLRPGGTLVISGATSGQELQASELGRIFFLQLRVQGSTMGTSAELRRLVNLLDLSGARPVVHEVMAMEKAAAGFQAMAGGDLFGKVVFTR
jgi:NADPH:quinone reductase-like Zn-dependent oxidoreductase